MTVTVEQETHNVGGLQVTVYRPEGCRSGSASALFFLHGRLGSKEKLDQTSRNLVAQSVERGSKSLLVVTLDHRNHGVRLLTEEANNAWDDRQEQNNDRHAVDMYAIQVGTAQDVSFLIDFLPSYISPDRKLEIERWGVAGVSLGGHSAWLTLAHDERVQFGVPIIGCPDYMALMRHRTAERGLPMEAPYFPPSLLKTIEEYDPAKTAYSSDGAENPFIGKKILVLSGAADTLVPWSASQNFVDHLEVGEDGSKRVEVYEGVGHNFTAEMEEELISFVLLSA
ncbi:Alpha/Beta hydrolase protein [Coprinopsis sp. MPI-PUGE-AT-0042]|nr:Alpha/Beta hydrolase protein [Coprinopsis sp. MPI-PUGE-AT-0042]